MILQHDYSLLEHNTFGLEVSANQFVEYSSVEELCDLLHTGIAKPYLHIGSGSNLLFTRKYPGTVLHSAIRFISLKEEDEEQVLVEVGAGVVWDDFVDYCVKSGWYGAENLSLIPGEVGAAAVQNIGAYGVEVKDLIRAVHTLDEHGNRRDFSLQECDYSYRNSVFKRPEMKCYFVTSVTFCLSKKPSFKLDYGTIRKELEAEQAAVTLENVRAIIIRIRNSKLPDPKVLGNAGSFFMNPIVPRAKFLAIQQEYPSMPFYEVDTDRVKIPAGWMIEQCGWKGKALGKAAVHDKQALVLVNLGGATSVDVIALSDAVRAAVRERFGIDIHPEVNFI